jgi:hypothetical protein
LTAFIIESKKMLEEDSTALVAEILISYMDNLANGAHTSFQRKEFVPTPASVSINCLFFASLGFTIVAALASVLALQWVAHYDAFTSRSGLSPEERVRRRQFKYGGTVKWEMKQIISALPVLVVSAVLLFFAGVCQWMWIMNRKVGAVVFSAAVAAAIFYLLTTVIAVISPSAPYRTALSRWTYILFSGVWRLVLVFYVLLTKKRASWLESSRFYRSTLTKRDISIIEGKKSSIREGLLRDALIWLANTISISNESRPKILLLVEEMLELNPEGQTLKSLTKAHWISILKVIKRPLFAKARQGTCTLTDYQECGLLIKCVHNPHIGRLYHKIAS